MPVASMASECHSAAGPISGILGFARTASKCGRQENGVTARGRRMPRALMDLSAGQRQCILCSSHYSHYGNTCRGTRARVTILTNLDTRHRHTAIRIRLRWRADSTGSSWESYGILRPRGPGGPLGPPELASQVPHVVVRDAVSPRPVPVLVEVHHVPGVEPRLLCAATALLAALAAVLAGRGAELKRQRC